MAYKRGDKVWLTQDDYLYPAIFWEEDGQVVLVYKYALGLYFLVESSPRNISLRVEQISYDIFTNRENYV